MVRRRKTKILLIVTPLVLIGLIIFFIHQMSSPAVGDLKSALPQSTPSKKTEGGTETYEGKIISFSYPAGYEKVASPQNSSGYLEVINLYSTDHTNTHLAVAVVRESLANDPGYNLRKAHPEIYKKVLSSPNDILFTSDKNGNEETEFIYHAGLVVSISMTVPGSRDLSKAFAVVTNSFQWQQ